MRQPSLPHAPHRRFSVFDALILIAATAAGLAWWRISEPFGLREAVLEPASFVASVGEQPKRILWVWFDIYELLVAWTLGVLALRLCKPRPSLRRIARQPGFVAECAVLVALVVNIGEFAGWRIAGGGLRGFVIVTLSGQVFAELAEDGLSFEETIRPIASAVASAWGVMFLARVLRPERSWIDRLGRSLGVLWLLTYLIRVGSMESD